MQRSELQVREITDRLEEGIRELFDSEKYQEYLRVMSKFYNYSFNNTLLIALQRPDATIIAGYNSWRKDFGRYVKKGEKAIKIFAPTSYKTYEKRKIRDPDTHAPILDANGEPVVEVTEVVRNSFRVVNVFDVSQTEGRELPDISVNELTGSVENYDDLFIALTDLSPVPIDFEEITGSAKGYFSHIENRIAIQEGMSEVQTVKTAIHEIAHAKLHSENNGKDRYTKEVEAESVAYTVCQHFGIETSDYSFGYIAGWSTDKETKELKSSLETIRNTAAEMIGSIEEKLRAQINIRTWDKKVAMRSDGNGYIEVHETDDGFDYSIYDTEMILIDGGVVDEHDTTAYELALTLCEEYGFTNPDIVADYDKFTWQALTVNEFGELPPVCDRETEILYDTLSSLGMNDIELTFDRDGLVATDGRKTWHGADFYKYIISKAGKRNLSTDFRELAEHNGVNLSRKTREKSMER